MERALF